MSGVSPHTTRKLELVLPPLTGSGYWIKSDKAEGCFNHIPFIIVGLVFSKVFEQALYRNDQ